VKNRTKYGLHDGNRLTLLVNFYNKIFPAREKTVRAGVSLKIFILTLIKGANSIMKDAVNIL
jgi:hypothetical protein